MLPLFSGLTRSAAMFEEMWADLAITLEEFLFSDSAPPPNQSLEEQQNDESLDTRVRVTLSGAFEECFSCLFIVS